MPGPWTQRLPFSLWAGDDVKSCNPVFFTRCFGLPLPAGRLAVTPRPLCFQNGGGGDWGPPSLLHVDGRPTGRGPSRARSLPGSLGTLCQGPCARPPGPWKTCGTPVSSRKREAPALFVPLTCAPRVYWGFRRARHSRYVECSRPVSSVRHPKSCPIPNSGLLDSAS